MNWKRGLFRLWVVISLLWLLAATGIALEIAAEMRPDTSAKSEWDELDPPKYMKVWHFPPWPVVIGVVAVPFLLLGLGSTAYWVARGFTRSN